MKIRFTDGHNVVMALAAVAKHFLVVDKSNHVKTQRGMTGLAPTAGSDVIRRLPLVSCPAPVKHRLRRYDNPDKLMIIPRD